jgi:hypothetical protein
VPNIATTRDSPTIADVSSRKPAAADRPTGRLAKSSIGLTCIFLARGFLGSFWSPERAAAGSGVDKPPVRLERP